MEESDIETIRYGDLVYLECSGSYLLSKRLSSSSLVFDSLDKISDQNHKAFRVLPKIGMMKALSQSKINILGIADTKREPLKAVIATNLHHYSKLSGAAVSLGSNIILQHLSTSKFLSVKTSNFLNFKSNLFKFKLTDFIEETCLIQISSVFSFQKHKNKLINEDKLYIEI